jgi:hypothetical protein
VTRLTLVVLVDALRHDYVARMPWLRSLAAESATGRLREDFGFLPRAAYFGGLSTSEHGFTNMFAFDPVRSPFGHARGLPTSRSGRDVEDVFLIRQWLESEARRRVSPFAASYLSTIEIPLDLLPDFTPTEQHAPWDPRVGYRSLFADLDAQGTEWFACSWPETNALPDHSDRGLVTETMARVRPPCRFAYLHLQELDGIGHAYGPESSEVHQCLARTDALLAETLDALERRFDQVDVILFGDHGMVSVTGTTDLWTALTAAPIHLGRDVSFFLDSTMARFWFKNSAARRHVVDALAPLAGRVLDAQDLEALDLTGCDPRNGELYFLADPGVLILPNFFQRRGRPCKGMHGYHPDCPDNQGFFLSRRADARGSSDAGIVSPRAVYEQSRQSLGLAPTPAALTHPRTRAPQVFTQHPDPAAHALVERHMAEIVTAARAALPRLEAVVLTGSFGRGEGGILTGDDGAFHPVNDYDVLLITPDVEGTDLASVGKDLAGRFGIDFVHFGWWPRVDPTLPLTLAHFDIREGHRVLWGPAEVLAALPAYAAIDMPPIEAVVLLMNRMAGLITGLRGPFTSPSPLGSDERRYLRNQTMKALMALGDAALMLHGAYACSYQTRLERLTWLAPGLGIEGEQLSAIQDAYAFKLHPTRTHAGDLVTLAARTSRWLLEAFTAATAQVAPGHVIDALGAARAYYDLMTSNPGAVSADNSWCLDMLARGDVPALPQPTGSVRQSIYAALPLLLAASHGDRTAFDAALDRLDDCLTPPWPSGLTAANWDAARQRTAHAWLTLVH